MAKSATGRKMAMQEKKMPVKGDFGRLLKSLRIRSGTQWTQESLAEALRGAGYKAATRTYKSWEKGEHIPPREVLKYIVALLGLNKEDEDALYRAAAHAPPNVKLDSSTAAQVPQIIDNLPFRPNPFFTGRETELEQLRTQLQETGTAAIMQPVSISGLGGIGKTELTLEYAHKSYPDVYRIVLWVNAANKETLQASYDSIAQLLKLPERDERELDRRVQAVKDWLKEHTSWLLIMDNADDLPLANTFLPSQPLGHILFTTRSQLVSDSDIAAQITVEEMEPKQGLDFLLRRSGIVQNKANLDAARQIVKLLGGIPLALDQAGAYIRTGVSCADYLERYDEHRHRLLSKRRLAGDKSSEQTRHPDSVALTFALIFQKVYDECPLTADILRFCAFLHPDAIPEELFHHNESFKPDMVELDEAVAVLQRYSLIKRNAQEKMLSMHRLVQAVIIDMLSPEIRTQWRERVVGALNAIFPNLESKGWKQFKRLVTHALVCATWTEDELTPTPDVSELFQKAGSYLSERGQYAEAEPLLVRAVSIREQHLGDENLSTASSLNSLALLYYHQRKYEQAVSLSQRALTIQEQQLGPKHPEIANTLNNLAFYCVSQGEYEQAEASHQRALSIREQCLGAEYPEIANSLINLAILYMLQEDKYEQAEALLRRVLTIYEQYLGTEQLDTTRSLYMLADVYQRQGKYEQAELLYQHALTIREQSLGSEHYDNTATIMNNLADLYRLQGKYEQAELLYQRAIATSERNFGYENLNTAYPIQGLAELYQQQGKYEQAEALFRRVLTIREQHLGPGHLGTQIARKAFVACLRILGRDAEATAIESSQS